MDTRYSFSVDSHGLSYAGFFKAGRDSIQGKTRVIVTPSDVTIKVTGSSPCGLVPVL